MKNKTLLVFIVIFIALIVIFAIYLGVNNSPKTNSSELESITNIEKLFTKGKLKGKETFDYLCSAVNQTYNEHTYSRISGSEIIYELNNEDYYISISANKSNDTINTIRLISLNKDKSLYYSISKLKFDGVTEEDIIDFLDGSIDGAGMYSPSGYSFLVNSDDKNNPILDIKIK